jgi:hypothetical protein
VTIESVTEIKIEIKTKLIGGKITRHLHLHLHLPHHHLRQVLNRLREVYRIGRDRPVTKEIKIKIGNNQG